MEPTDREIVAQVLAGDEASFHVLVRRHSAPLWSTLRAHLANAEDAREVLQESWLRAFERLADLREPERLRSWLLSIALNLARQRQRRRAPETAGEWDACGDGGEPLEPGEDPAEALARREAERRLRAEVARLPPRQRQVVDLRLNHGLGHGEIAAVLGIREENSRANFYQALRRLRERCGELGGERQQR